MTKNKDKCCFARKNNPVVPGNGKNNHQKEQNCQWQMVNCEW
jgi:hypothetical protein